MIDNSHTRHGRRRLPALAVGLLAVGLAAAGPSAAPAQAQVDRTIPSAGYYAAFSWLYDGRYEEALDQFRDAAREAIRTPQARWIDSICYETMVGECYYHMGRLPEANEHYTEALTLAVNFSDWMVRVQFSPIGTPSARTRIPWGASSRQSRLGSYPQRMPIAQEPITLFNGRIDQGDGTQRATIVEMPIARLVGVSEIVRCTTLAIRRRAELLGPLAPEDPLFDELLSRLSRRPGPPNHWSEAWIDVQLGLAYSAVGKTVQAAPYLKRATVAAGEFDHPLTSTALLELGRLALAGGNYANALEYSEEATYAAACYPNMGVMEEAFRIAALAHLLDNRKEPYRPLVPAIAWSAKEDCTQLRVSLALSAAENAAVLGQTQQAATFLNQARTAMARRDMGNGRIGARLNYLSALALFQQGKVAEGDDALAAAMGYMQRGSHWLLHISLLDDLYGEGGLRDRGHLAMELYAKVLRDPQPTDWALEPMEAMAMLTTPHPSSIDNWFAVAMGRRDFETAVEITDRARRHRFFSSLGFGGRLLSLRWILEGPQEVLDQQSRLLRGDLLTRYPAYDRLRQQAQTLRTALEAMPVAPEAREQAADLAERLAALADLSGQQEAILREMAVRREPAGLAFPPLQNTQRVQQSLPEGHALLLFHVSRGRLYGFLLNNSEYDYWQVQSSALLPKRIVALLREMGHFRQNHVLTLQDLAETGWKESSREILDLLLEGSDADFAAEFDELVIVPDGILWYLPFEALHVEVDGKLRPLISRFRIRYAPTVGLATAEAPPRAAGGHTAVVAGRLFPGEDLSVAEEASARIVRVLPGAVTLRSSLPAPSAVFGSLLDGLIVLDDLNVSDEGPYGWAPAAIDRRKPGSSLGDWLCLPWEGPGVVILPGYHTAAEESLKGVSETSAGDEIFLSLCGLMASGARTVLLSRWRTGGQTSFDLVREFAQELPRIPPADAWQRSVFLAAGSRVNPEAEPRVRGSVNDEPPPATHPFLWAGYVLVDSGIDPPAEAEPEEPVLKFK